VFFHIEPQPIEIKIGGVVTTHRAFPLFSLVAKD